LFQNQSVPQIRIPTSVGGFDIDHKLSNSALDPHFVECFDITFRSKVVVRVFLNNAGEIAHKQHRQQFNSRLVFLYSLANRLEVYFSAISFDVNQRFENRAGR